MTERRDTGDAAPAGSFPTFVLNLAASAGRRARMREQLQTANLTARWVSAVDGAAPNSECEAYLLENGARREAGTPARRPSRDLDAPLVVDWKEIELLDRIGGGSFGDVYRANWKSTPVAAKCLHPRKAGPRLWKDAPDVSSRAAPSCFTESSKSTSKEHPGERSHAPHETPGALDVAHSRRDLARRSLLRASEPPRVFRS